MLVAYRFPLKMQRFHAPQVILSYGLYLVNGTIPQNDSLSVIINFSLVLFCSSIFISANWILTNLSIIAMSILSLGYYTFSLGYGMTQLMVSLILIMIVLGFTTYYCEKRVKTEYL